MNVSTKYSSVISSAAALSIAIIVGCAPEPRDLWFNEGPRFYHETSANAIPDDSLVAVSERERSAAEKQLIRSPIVEISTNLATLYLDQKAPRNVKGNPYLVRGLYYQMGTGAFKACYADHSLYVFHSSLDPSKSTAKKWPLVIWLETKPTNVFITCEKAR